MSAFTCSRACLADSNKLFNLVNQGYQREKTRREGIPRFSSEEEVKVALQDSKIYWLVMKDQGKVIGSLQVEEKNGRHLLGAFAVDPDYRSYGLGTRMIREVEDHLRSNEIMGVFLEVISVAKEPLQSDTKVWKQEIRQIEAEIDPLAQFYQKLGFQFCDEVEIPSSTWQNQTRKDEYLDRVFFRVMEKQL